MANLKETSTWENGIYQIEENDPVHGGENGITNRPAKQLANRTKWLKDQLDNTKVEKATKPVDTDVHTLKQDGIYALNNGGINLPTNRGAYKILSLAGNNPGWVHQLAIKAYSTEIWLTSQQSQNSEEWLAWKRLDGADWEDVRNKPTASTEQAGVVQLNDSLASTSTTQALTANQGKLLEEKKLDKTTVFTVEGNRNVYRYHDVAMFYKRSESVVGVVALKLPTYFTTMYMMTLQGFDYNHSSSWSAEISAYQYRETTVIKPSIIVHGKAPFNKICFASKNGSQYILFGETNTIWSFPTIHIKEVLTHFNNQQHWATGYEFSLETDLSSFQILATPPLYGTPRALTAEKLVTPRTINGVAFDGTQNIKITDDTKVEKSTKPADTDVRTLKQDGIYALNNGGINLPTNSGAYKILSLAGNSSAWVHQLAIKAYSTEIWLTSQQSQNSEEWLAWKRLDGADWGDVRNKPTASTTQAGVVQLNSQVNSSLETQAATPKAVKAAYDRAIDAEKKALPVGSVVAFPKQINNPTGFLLCDGRTFAQATYPDLYRTLGNQTTLPNLNKSDVGQLSYFPSSTIPSGWLECNGQTISRTVYPELYAYLGNRYGANGKLPDAQDRFIRNAGNGLSVGQVQEDDIKSHSHIYQEFNNATGTDVRNAITVDGNGAMRRISGIATSNTGGVETRPKSIAFKLCIKAVNSFDDVRFWIKAFGEVVNVGQLDASRLANELRTHSHTTAQITDFSSAVQAIINPLVQPLQQQVQAIQAVPQVKAMCNANLSNPSNVVFRKNVGFAQIEFIRNNSTFKFVFAQPMPNANYVINATQSWAGYSGSSADVFEQTREYFVLVFRYGGDNTVGTNNPERVNVVVFD